MKILVLTLFFALSLSSCQKDEVVCYQCNDNNGNQLFEACGENEQDAFNNSGNIDGVHTIVKFRAQCVKK